jgi:hypothetical protein
MLKVAARVAHKGGALDERTSKRTQVLVGVIVCQVRRVAGSLIIEPVLDGTSAFDNFACHSLVTTNRKLT